MEQCSTHRPQRDVRAPQSAARACGLLMRVRVDAVSPSPNRARASCAGIESLAASIAQHGLISPIVVRPSATGYELIAGERRLRACAALGCATIDALVVGRDAREAALLGLLENMQRENLHFIEEAMALARLQAAFGFSQRALSALLGFSQPAIANKIRLLALPEAVLTALPASGLTERHARALLSLGDPGAQWAAMERARDEGMSVAQLERYIARISAQTPPKRQYRLCVRDRRLLINAVLGAVKSLREAGIMATTRVEESPDHIDVVVSLPLTSARSAAPSARISAQK